MRKSVWILENIKGDFSFFQKFNLLCLFASVSLWRKHHPDHYTVLYCDLMTKALFEELGVLDLWHEVNWRKLSEDSGIDKSVFWAGCKPQILSQLEEPVTIVDNDWLPFRSFEKEMSMAPVVYSHDEDGSNYYLKDDDWYVEMLKDNIELWPMTDDSLNVSFLTFNDLKIQKEYADLSVKIMQEWTNLKIKDNRLIIFAEQKILKQLLLRDKIKHQPLMKSIWYCKGEWWHQPDVYKRPSDGKGENEHGIVEWQKSQLHFKHYGTHKRNYKDNDLPRFPYEPEVMFLYRCIANSGLLKTDSLKERLNDLVKRV